MAKKFSTSLTKNLKPIRSGKYIQFKDKLSPNKIHEYIFSVKDNGRVPIGFDAWNLQANIDMSLWKFNSKKNHWSYISESVNSGNADEYIFALLPSGEYLLEIKYKNSFAREELPSKYNVSFDGCDLLHQSVGITSTCGTGNIYSTGNTVTGNTVTGNTGTDQPHH